MTRHELIDRLAQTHDLSDEEFLALLCPICEEKPCENWTPEEEAYLYEKARAAREPYYGKDVYLRGLIEFTSYCKNNCYYCGIRCGNPNASRYRLRPEQILSCCEKGHALGFRTFVLQGGEDPYYTDDIICNLVSSIKNRFPDCAVTLSIGEKERESYEAYFRAGADRYLLREETSDPSHYRFLHPKNLSMEHRQNCLLTLKEIGYQVGCGIMIESPGQRPEHILKDLRFMQRLKPHMIGAGPFIPHHDTRFAGCPAGSLDATLHLTAVFRLMFPDVLLPATTALGTITPNGREQGLLAGGNVVMPNLSPADVRGSYLLYDGKICQGDEAAECVRCLSRRIAGVGMQVVSSRGDHVGFIPQL